MNVILDFDYTLFDAALLREAVGKVFLQNGVDRDLFFRTLEESKKGQVDWKPFWQLELLKRYGVRTTEKIQREFERVVGDAHLFLYSDTLPFLEKAKRSHSLKLLSYGEDAFQQMKIQGCRIGHYFDDIVITRNLVKDREAKELAGKTKSVFVEDNPRALEAAKQHHPELVTIRIWRGGGAWKDEPSGRGIDYEAKDLREVERFITGIL